MPKNFQLVAGDERFADPIGEFFNSAGFVVDVSSKISGVFDFVQFHAVLEMDMGFAIHGNVVALFVVEFEVVLRAFCLNFSNKEIFNSRARGPKSMVSSA